MAEGVRIRLIEGRRPGRPAIVAIRDVTRRGDPDPDGNYPGCAACNLPSPGHQGYKTKHVRIDADGYGIVAVPYWEDMQKLVDNGGFELANPVPEPPTQKLSFEIKNGEVTGRVQLLHKWAQPILSEKLAKKE